MQAYKRGAKRRSKKNLYLAAPLFSEAERSFNLLIRERLLPCASIFLPQEDGFLLTKLLRDGVDHARASQMVFDQDLAAIRSCDGLVAVLDGRSIDEGVAFELGVSFVLGKMRIGLQTDPRRLLGGANNPMIEGALDKVFDSVDALSSWLKDWSET